MADKKRMSKEDAARIQSYTDKTGTNKDFKARVQRCYEWVWKILNPSSYNQHI